MGCVRVRARGRVRASVRVRFRVGFRLEAPSASLVSTIIAIRSGWLARHPPTGRMAATYTPPAAAPASSSQ